MGERTERSDRTPDAGDRAPKDRRRAGRSEPSTSPPGGEASRGPAAGPGFAELGLPVELVQALRRERLETAFPIQAAAIPDALAGRDVLGRAATGSGKTLAFGLPMLA
ncbi:DEAD/DEAH box helicase, partial [Nocardia nova]|uniref:DEAD/DEAH box helicase n=1 Tax=Nocardia nova TaxID=37330 RepID=UPI0025B1275D